MKFTIGRSKNEHLEIVISIILVGIGGYLTSFIQLNDWLMLTILSAFGFFASGILFALRVSFKITYDNKLNRELLEEARKQLEETIEKRAQQMKEEANQQSIINSLIFG